MTECKASAKSRQDCHTVVDPLSLFCNGVYILFSIAWDGQHHAGKGAALQKFIVIFFFFGVAMWSVTFSDVML